jgi:hypothetical protein
MALPSLPLQIPLLAGVLASIWKPNKFLDWYANYLVHIREADLGAGCSNL